MESAVNPGRLYGAGTRSQTLSTQRIWAWVGEGERHRARHSGSKEPAGESCELGQSGQSWAKWGALSGTGPPSPGPHGHEVEGSMDPPSGVTQHWGSQSPRPNEWLTWRFHTNSSTRMGFPKEATLLPPDSGVRAQHSAKLPQTLPHTVHSLLPSQLAWDGQHKPSRTQAWSLARPPRKRKVVLGRVQGQRHLDKNPDSNFPSSVVLGKSIWPL